MGKVVAIGRGAEIAGFGLAGVELCPVQDDPAARDAYAGLGADVSLVIMSASVARAVAAAREAPPAGRSRPLEVVLPS